MRQLQNVWEFPIRDRALAFHRGGTVREVQRRHHDGVTKNKSIFVFVEPCNRMTKRQNVFSFDTALCIT